MTIGQESLESGKPAEVELLESDSIMGLQVSAKQLILKTLRPILNQRVYLNRICRAPTSGAIFSWSTQTAGTLAA